ncbi:MAG TPA: lipopolysaccharide biosynthesis protein [Flavobacteriales bacterium]|nr:lipopolysaccharide biosynthesis protein [Flavobacteriales bacterium]
MKTEPTTTANSQGGRPFLHAVATLFTGTVLAQAIPFVLAPVIARLYNAEQFAMFGTLLAVFNMLNVVAAGRYDQAVVLPKERGVASDLVKGSLLIVAAFSLLVAAVLLAFGPKLEQAIALNDLHVLVGPLVLLTLLAGAQLVMLQWLLRHRAFAIIARQKVLQSVTVTGLTVLFGWLAWYNGLVSGYLAGWVVYTAATLAVVVKRHPLGPGWDWKGIKDALRAYKDWPLHNAWPSVLNAVASGMAPIYMVAYFSVQVVGEHNFARQYLLVPISMVSVALGQVLFERTASKVRNGGPVMSDIRRVTFALLAIALAAALLITFLGEPLFALVFGEQWAYAGRIAGILIWGYVAQLVGSPLGSQLIAMGKVKAAMAFPVFYAALLACLPLFRSLSAERFMALLSATEVIAYGGYAAWVWYHGRQYELAIARTK